MNMNRFFNICLFVSALFFCACNNGETEYIVEPTPINITVLTDHITAGTAQVRLEPEDDRAYFYAQCMRRDSAYVPGTMDKDFMILIMDSVYIDYLSWRHDLLVKGEKYIAPFSSHELKYGHQTAHYVDLEPQTEYIVFAFCVNPVNNQPMGDLYFATFTTDSLKDVAMTFQFVIDRNTMYIMPSDDDNYYVCSYEKKSVFEDEYGGSVYRFLNSEVAFCKQFNLMEYLLVRNAQRLSLDTFFEANQRYIFCASGYDGALSTHVTKQEVYIDPDGIGHLVSE